MSSVDSWATVQPCSGAAPGRNAPERARDQRSRRDQRHQCERGHVQTLLTTPPRVSVPRSRVAVPGRPIGAATSLPRASIASSVGNEVTPGRAALALPHGRWCRAGRARRRRLRLPPRARSRARGRRTPEALCQGRARRATRGDERDQKRVSRKDASDFPPSGTSGSSGTPARCAPPRCARTALAAACHRPLDTHHGASRAVDHVRLRAAR